MKTKQSFKNLFKQTKRRQKLEIGKTMANWRKIARPGPFPKGKTGNAKKKG